VDVKARCHKCDQNWQTLQLTGARFPCKVGCWKMPVILRYSLVNLCHFGINGVYSRLSNYEWVSPLGKKTYWKLILYEEIFFLKYCCISIMNNTIVGLFTLNYHLSKPLGKATSGGKYCNWNLFLLLYSTFPVIATSSF